MIFYRTLVTDYINCSTHRGEGIWAIKKIAIYLSLER